MTATVNVINSLVGPTHILTESDVSNWDDIIDLVTTDPCTFEVHYDGDIITGTLAKSLDGLSIQVAFDSTLVALPGGMCLLMTCGIVPVFEEGCYDTRITDLDISKRIMILDDDGCPEGYMFINDLVNIIVSQLDIPTTLCELIGAAGITEGNLVASDRILTTTGDPACTLKSVPQSQVLCP